MPVHATNDPLTDLESAEPGRVVYRDRQSGERWAELGTCNQCGLCMVGSPHPVEWTGEPGTPGAARCLDYETRPHFVTRPTIKRHYPTCSLEFEVL